MPVESDGSVKLRFPGQCGRSHRICPTALVPVPRLGDPVLPEPPCTAWSAVRLLLPRALTLTGGQGCSPSSSLQAPLADEPPSALAWSPPGPGRVPGCQMDVSDSCHCGVPSSVTVSAVQ